MEDFQLSPLRFEPVLPSLNLPVAVNLIDVPWLILGFAGLMVIETSDTLETVSVVEPLTLPSVALMVAVPVLALVAIP